MSKNLSEIIFGQKLEREGVTQHIVKTRSTLFIVTDLTLGIDLEVSGNSLGSGICFLIEGILQTPL